MEGSGIDKVSAVETRKLYGCLQCDFTSAWPSNVTRHEAAKHDVELWNEAVYYWHIMLTATDPARQRYLDYLRKRYMRCIYRSLNQDLVIGGRKKLLRCSKCEYSSDKLFNITRHENRLHKWPKNLLQCCDIVFETKAEYYLHQKRIHYVERDNLSSQTEFRIYNGGIQSDFSQYSLQFLPTEEIIREDEDWTICVERNHSKTFERTTPIQSTLPMKKRILKAYTAQNKIIKNSEEITKVEEMDQNLE